MSPSDGEEDKEEEEYGESESDDWYDEESDGEQANEEQEHFEEWESPGESNAGDPWRELDPELFVLAGTPLQQMLLLPLRQGTYRFAAWSN
jgi:hypothetical protein